MYEGKIVQTQAEEPAREDRFDADGLRPLSWGELTARLDAARDFRRLLGSRHEAGAGSFNLASARHLAGLGEGKPGINPIALANGKSADGMEFADEGNDMSRDRGME